MLARAYVCGPPRGDKWPDITWPILFQAHVCRHGCRSLLPYSTLIWSDILPRHWYQGARSQSSVELKRKTVNKTARAIVLAGGCKVFKHANINWASRSLFRDNYLHLDTLGQFLFTNNLREALHFFYRFPEAQVQVLTYMYRWGKFTSRQIHLPQDKFVWPLFVCFGFFFLFAYKQKWIVNMV